MTRLNGEIHGFASLLHNRFAIIGAIVIKEHVVVRRSVVAALLPDNAIKHAQPMFVNGLFLLQLLVNTAADCL